jgi:hypothetical protein
LAGCPFYREGRFSSAGKSCRRPCHRRSSSPLAGTWEQSERNALLKIHLIDGTYNPTLILWIASGDRARLIGSLKTVKH